MQDQLKTKDQQLSKKDEQLQSFQETMREQLRLLTYAGDGLGTSMEKVNELQKELDKKEIELQKLSEDTARKVLQMLRQKEEVETKDAEVTESEDIQEEVLEKEGVEVEEIQDEILEQEEIEENLLEKKEEIIVPDPEMQALRRWQNFMGQESEAIIKDGNDQQVPAQTEAGSKLESAKSLADIRASIAKLKAPS